MSAKDRVAFVTSSSFKRAESDVFMRVCQLPTGEAVGSLFEFDIRAVPIKEILDVDLRVMVQAEVVSAYSQIKIPCVVEHAGLIFDGYESYPGGLTKPMWDTLGDRFVAETQAAGRKAVARAVVAYCDGMHVKTFVGERSGRIAPEPRGERKFYWDTVFIPDDPSGKSRGMTYAEIVGDASLGLDYKIRELSQSSRAMLQFLKYRRDVGVAELWR